MTIEEKQQEIIEEFETFDDWMQKYEYIIDLGKDTPTLTEDLKTEDRLIHGCQSRVWLNAEIVDGKMNFSADSDAIITKGIIGLLIRVMNDETPETIVKCDLHFIKDIGLHEHLSPTRSNGLASMVQKMKKTALSSIKN